MNNLAFFHFQSRQSRTAFFAAALCVLTLAASAHAQSTDQEFPTPVGSSEISGVIVPRDVGDPRLTRYFYSFIGTPGDLVVTVESKNLNGDVDIFMASGLRPLAKLSMYSGELSTSTSKSIYLRQRVPLVLRVEGRSPNDNQGSFRIRFGGAFEPLPVSESAQPEAETPTVTARTDKSTRRVTSVGGRIDEPVVETTEETPPEPTKEVAKETTTPEATTPVEPTPETTEPAKPTPPRTARTRQPRTRRGRARPAPSATESTSSTAQPETPASQPEAGPRLIIETKDGMRVERFMNTVRRVTVENGQIVVVTKDGKVQREPMTNVLRMSIEP